MSESPPQLSFAADAVGSSEDVGQSVDEGKARIFPCEGCGADLEFNIGQQEMKCPYCGYQKEIELPDGAKIEEQDFSRMLARMRELHEHGRHDEEGQKEIRCNACGGTVVFVGSLTSSECPYCGSPIQLQDVHDAEHRVPVDAVLPFLVEKDKARSNLGAWIKSRWFAPNEFLKRGVDGKFNGVYLPYWTYDTLTANRYTGERGEHYWVTQHYTDNEGKSKTRQVRKTRWWPASGNFQRFFDDVLVPATKGLRHDIMIKLEPWPLGKCVVFNQQMLAGYLARTYEIELDAGFQEARERIDTAIRTDVRQRIGGDEQRIHSVNTHYGALTFKHLLLPLWLLAYRYKEKTFQVFVNAATGEVQGERPYSWVKITLAILAGVAAIGTIAVIASQ